MQSIRLVNEEIAADSHISFGASVSYNNDPHAPILIAVPDEWQNMISEFLEQQGYSVLTASSQDNALQIIQSQSLCIRRYK